MSDFNVILQSILGAGIIFALLMIILSWLCEMPKKGGNKDETNW